MARMLGSGILLASPKCTLYGRISKINTNLISVERNRGFRYLLFSMLGLL